MFSPQTIIKKQQMSVQNTEGLNKERPRKLLIAEVAASTDKTMLCCHHFQHRAEWSPCACRRAEDEAQATDPLPFVSAALRSGRWNDECLQQSRKTIKSISVFFAALWLILKNPQHQTLPK
jgi:hypothetical protein